MLKVRDLMTTELVTFSPELSLRNAVEVLARRHLTGAPVVAGGDLVGVISMSDILDFESNLPAVPTARGGEVEQGEWEPPGEWEEGGEAPGAFFEDMWADAGADVLERFEELEGPEWDLLAEHTVAEAMTRVVCSVRPETTVRDAARRMVEGQIHRVVVKENGRVAGILSAMDVVRAVAAGRL